MFSSTNRSSATFPKAFVALLLGSAGAEGFPSNVISSPIGVPVGGERGTTCSNDLYVNTRTVSSLAQTQLVISYLIISTST